jgi:DNA repair exonuclease SbcCD ATPase subunit
MHEADAVGESIKSAETYAAGLTEDRAAVTKLEAEAKSAGAQDPVPQKFYDGEREQQAGLGALQQEQLGAKQQFDAERAARVAKLQADYQALVLQRDQEVVAAGSPSPEQKLAEEESAKLFQESHGAEKAKLEAEARLQAGRARNETEQHRYQGDNARYLAAKRSADERADLLAAGELKMRAEEDFWALLKSFLNLVFDETLQCVAARANELLVGVPNVAGLTLDFTSERETKSGTVRQEIKLVVRKDGHEIPFRSGCSGGQQAVIELAVDLALAEVIAERTSVYPGWLVLDEPFDGLGAVGQGSVHGGPVEGGRGPRHLRHRPHRRGEVLVRLGHRRQVRRRPLDPVVRRLMAVYVDPLRRIVPQEASRRAALERAAGTAGAT